MWYTGQELEFVIGSPAYKQQFDRNGDSWLSLVNDVSGQYRRYGRQVFAPGPWPGVSLEELAERATGDERKAFEQAADSERRRNRKAPLI